MTKDEIKARIRALLNTASNDASTEGEIDNAMRFAQRLMHRHHLTEDECLDDGNIHEKAADQDWEMDTGRAAVNSSMFRAWELALGLWVAKFVGGVKHFPLRCRVNPRQSAAAG